MSDEEKSATKTTVSFRKTGKLRPVRGREGSGKQKSNSSSSDEETQIIKRQKIEARNPMVQSTSSSFTKRQQQVAESTDSEEDDRAKLLGVAYKSSKTGESLLPRDMGATSTMETETDFTVDAQAQFERTQKIIQESRGKADDKIYRGMATYTHVEKKDTAAGNAASGFVRKGPIRAPTFLRQSVRWDYQPDLCKDYKETGYCGFGDSCKFLHDRTDYKHGWELERDWNQGRYGKDDEDPNQYKISDDEDELPFKCLICRNSFVNPIVTKCKHYFCEKCALTHYQKTQKCYVCEKNTGGVFNPAKDIITRMKGESTKRKRDVGEDGSPLMSDDEASNPDLPEVQPLPEEGQPDPDVENEANDNNDASEEET